MLTPRHSHTSFYLPKWDEQLQEDIRQIRHVGGNGT